jgi:hypothetical protein
MPSARQSLIALLSLLCAPVYAQWMVYDVRINADLENSVNFNPYTGIYLIMPVEGGRTTMVFATENAGRLYAVSREAGRYFIAANAEKRRGVFSSIVIDRTVQAMYQASGSLNGTLAYRIAGEHRATRIPLLMTGTFMASDSEVETTVPDGSDIGVAGQATLTATYRTDLTRILQDQPEPSLENSIQVISDLLEKYGYQPDTEPLPGTELPPLSTETPPPPPHSPAPQEPLPTGDGSLFPPGSREEMEEALR